MVCSDARQVEQHSAGVICVSDPCTYAVNLVDRRRAHVICSKLIMRDKAAASCSYPPMDSLSCANEQAEKASAEAWNPRGRGEGVRGHLL